MRKLTLAFLLIQICLASYSQSPILDFSKAYFRSDPFASTARNFLQHLLNDPDIADKKTELRTDSTLFGFEGRYLKYNPFFFRPEKVEISLSEIALPTTDSLLMDTVMFYQLAAYAPATPTGLKDVTREVEKIHRQYRKKFFKASHEEIKNDTQTQPDGVVNNYFLPLYGIAPVTVGWLKLENNSGYMLLITLRLSIRNNNNLVDLPAPLYYTK